MATYGHEGGYGFNEDQRGVHPEHVQRANEESELERLRRFHSEVCVAIGSEGPRGIEHALAIARLGKETTVIGRARLAQLHKAEADLEIHRSPHAMPESGELRFCLVCATDKPWGVFDPKTGAAVCIDCRDKARS